MNSVFSRRAAGLLPLLLIAGFGAAHASCGSAFCSVNTNWDVQGSSTEPGLRADLRYEYIDQDQPRHGKDKVGVGEIPRHHDEVRTVNRNWIGTLDYTFNRNWGATVTVPTVDREHTHVHNHRGAQLEESWDFREVGVVRVLGRWQRFSEHTDTSPRHDFSGLQFGLKLPTGKRDIANSAGELAERTLQPGTGTTDLVLGAYYGSDLPQSSMSWFAQTHYQQPVNTRDDYRPGRRLSIDVGVRYQVSEKAGLMLQLNTLFRGRDGGGQAEAEDSGGKSVFLSPGFGYALSRDVQLYGFVQLAVYQFVNGVQLTADRAAVLGISSRF
jgi:hypothetical protein